MTSRIEPPLVITYEQIDAGMQALTESLAIVSEQLRISIASHLDSLTDIPPQPYVSPRDPLEKIKIATVN
jgi:hypothetical protein